MSLKPVVITESNASLLPMGSFPEGATVFLFVTPDTGSSLDIGWRPRPYFLLRTTVEQVRILSFSEDEVGVALYSLAGTYFEVRSQFLSDDESYSRWLLKQIFDRETRGTIETDAIEVHDVSEEIAARKEYLERQSGEDSSVRTT